VLECTDDEGHRADDGGADDRASPRLTEPGLFAHGHRGEASGGGPRRDKAGTRIPFLARQNGSRAARDAAEHGHDGARLTVQKSTRSVALPFPRRMNLDHFSRWLLPNDGRRRRRRRLAANDPGLFLFRHTFLLPRRGLLVLGSPPLRRCARIRRHEPAALVARWAAAAAAGAASSARVAFVRAGA